MWEWLTDSAVWALIGSVVVLLLLFLGGDWVQGRIEKVVPEKWRERAHKNLRLAFWTINGIMLAIIVLAAAVIVISRKGIYAMVTPETIEAWFLEHGPGILVILAVGLGLWFALKELLPPLLRYTV